MRGLTVRAGGFALALASCGWPQARNLPWKRQASGGFEECLV